MENQEKNKSTKSFKKKLIIIVICGFIIGLIIGWINANYARIGGALAKPVIYIYNTNINSSDIDITINKEKLSFEYPYRTNNWWYVKTNNNGIIVYPNKNDRNKNINGKEYNYLFWEDISKDFPYSFDEGFCIKGKDTRYFLENTLYKLGMNSKEINEFIVYWLPKMENNKYNVISFQTDNYNKSYPLIIKPNADNVLRVFMAFYPSNNYINIKEQSLDKVKNNFERDGLYIVEWGGSELDERYHK